MSAPSAKSTTLIRQMSADGRIVLFSSTELPELIGLCDRIIVLYRGRLVGEVAEAASTIAPCCT